MTPTAIEFSVEGLPRPKGSAKAFRHNGTGKVIVQASNRGPLRMWEACVRAAAIRVKPRDRFYGPVRLAVTFYLPRPVSIPVAKRQYPAVKPDLSKLLRGIEDALSGVLYNDDAQIVEVTTAKVYSHAERQPGASVTLTPLEGR